MKKKLCAAIIFLLLIMIFPEKVYGYQTHKLFFYELKNSEIVPALQPLNFYGNFSLSQITFIIFDNLIDSKNLFIPENAQLLSVEIKNQNLILNLSPQIKNYGGSYYEKHLLNQIKKNVSALNLKSFSILVDGKSETLPEGILYQN